MGTRRERPRAFACAGDTLYLLYLDESGVPERGPSQASHYVSTALEQRPEQVHRIRDVYRRDDLPLSYQRCRMVNEQQYSPSADRPPSATTGRPVKKSHIHRLLWKWTCQNHIEHYDRGITMPISFKQLASRVAEVRESGFSVRVNSRKGSEFTRRL